MGFPLSVPLIGADILRETSDKRHPLGTRGVTRDGRAFRYTKNGAVALLAAEVVQSSVPIQGQALAGAGATAIKANTSKITVFCSATSPFSTAGSYDEGYLWAASTSTAKGVGQYVQIKTQAAGSSDTTATVVMNLVDGDAFYSPTSNFGSTAVHIQAIRNPYHNVVVKPGGEPTALVVGVPARPVTKNYYFWLQTWGPCPVRVTGTVDIGYPLGWSSGASAGYADMCTSTKATSSFAGPMTLWRNLIAADFGVTMNADATAGAAVLVYLKLAP